MGKPDYLITVEGMEFYANFNIFEDGRVELFEIEKSGNGFNKIDFFSFRLQNKTEEIIYLKYDVGTYTLKPEHRFEESIVIQCLKGIKENKSEREKNEKLYNMFRSCISDLLSLIEMDNMLLIEYI